MIRVQSHVLFSLFISFCRTNHTSTDSPHSTMDVFVVWSCGSREHIEVALQDTLHTLKVTLALKRGCDPHDMALYLDGTLLDVSEDTELRSTAMYEDCELRVRCPSQEAIRKCRQLNIKLVRDSLILWISRGDEERVKLLLDTKMFAVDSTTSTRNGVEAVRLLPPLLVAVKNRQHGVAALLLSRGADPNVTQQRRFAPSIRLTHHAYKNADARLHPESAINLAVINVDLPMVKLLVEAGASLDVKGAEGTDLRSTLAKSCNREKTKKVKDEKKKKLVKVKRPVVNPDDVAGLLEYLHTCPGSPFDRNECSLQKRWGLGYSMPVFCAYNRKFPMLYALMTKSYIAHNPMTSSAVLSACVYGIRRNKASLPYPCRTREATMKVNAKLYSAAVDHLCANGAKPLIVQDWEKMPYYWRHWEHASCAMMERYGGKRGKDKYPAAKVHKHAGYPQKVTEKEPSFPRNDGRRRRR